MSKEESFAVLFTALRSFKEALIDDENVIFMEMDAFLLDDGTNSLQNKITTLEAGLIVARNHVLRIVLASISTRNGWKERVGGKSAKGC